MDKLVEKIKSVGIPFPNMLLPHTIRIETKAKTARRNILKETEKTDGIVQDALSRAVKAQPNTPSQELDDVNFLKTFLIPIDLYYFSKNVHI